MASVPLSIARRLTANQCPQWAGLPLRRLHTSGTEHRTFALGEEFIVRLPRDGDAEAGLVKEIAWWPRLGDALPVEVPEVVYSGVPEEDTGRLGEAAAYPYRWAITRWVPGADAAATVLDGGRTDGWPETLAAIVLALRSIDLGAIPVTHWPRGGRGGHLSDRLRALDETRDALAGPLDATPLTPLIGAALAVEPDPTPVVLHADLIPGNLVVRGGRIVGLLDLGTLTTGYAAWDLTPAWWVLDRAGRDRFRALVDADDDAWLWGRVLAATQGLLAHWYYTPRHHALAPLGARAVRETLAC